MGISFRASGKSIDASWSYSGFSSFRSRLAEKIGIDLNSMEGFGRFDKSPRKSWDTINDPIKPFLNHSDCDGELSPEECKSIASRLRELVKAWHEDDYDKVNALKLADAMDLCVQEGVCLEFR